jgi:hypothetical protein
MSRRDSAVLAFSVFAFGKRAPDQKTLIFCLVCRKSRSSDGFPAMRCAFAPVDRAFGTLVLGRNMAGGERGAPYFEPGSM